MTGEEKVNDLEGIKVGKGRRLRMQRIEREERLRQAGTYTPVADKDLKEGFSYWITGVLWEHDKMIIEPFCAVFTKYKGWVITSLDDTDIEYHYARLLLGVGGSPIVFEDRLTAINVCEAFENEKTLLDSFMSYMTGEEVAEYVANKVGANNG